MRAIWIGLLVVALLGTLSGVASAQGEGSAARHAVANAVSLVRPSVVAIETRFAEPTLNDDYIYWHYMRGARPLYGLWGTGFIYKDPQYVITSDFLMGSDQIGSNAEYIRVILDDGRSYEAELVGKDTSFEVAVLKVDWGPDLEPISPPFGDSDELRLGTPIAIVGKALNSVDTFATAGIISAIRKQLPRSDEPTDKFLQFDASFELSFTGAPLIDTNGNVVGMVDRTVGESINLGVPVNDIIYIADRMIAGENIGIWFGAETTHLVSGIIDWGGAPRYFDWDGDGEAEEMDFGRWVSYVEPGSPADYAGLQMGDTIVEIDSTFMKFSHEWDAFFRALAVGQLINVEFIRKQPDADPKSSATEDFYRAETQVQILEEVDESDDDADSGGSTAPPNPHGY